MKDKIKDAFKPENIRNTWEFKSIAFLLRAGVALLVIVYLLVTMPASWIWAKASWIRHQPASRFAEMVVASEKTGDFQDAHDWLSMRPQTEMPQHAATIEEHAATLPALFFHWNTQAARNAGDDAQVLFWSTYQKYRMRYDVLRCGDPALVSKVDELSNAAAALTGINNELTTVQDDPQKMTALLQQVLDYDAKNPAANDPRTTCKAFEKISTHKKLTPVPRETWADIRHVLRRVTEAAISDMKQGMP